jgi:nicotinamide riboside transporter PnuC
MIFIATGLQWTFSAPEGYEVCFMLAALSFIAGFAWLLWSKEEGLRTRMDIGMPNGVELVAFSVCSAGVGLWLFSETIMDSYTAEACDKWGGVVMIIGIASLATTSMVNAYRALRVLSELGKQKEA